MKSLYADEPSLDTTNYFREVEYIKIFIGSSSKSKIYCDEIASMLQDLEYTPVLWSEDDVFIAGRITWDSLAEKFSTVDAGVFVIAPDDCLDTGVKVARDNVWIELGLMAGQKGIDNTAIFRTDNSVHIPSDCNGITRIDYSNQCRQLKKNE